MFYAYSKSMQLGRSPKILFVFGIILILFVSGFIFFVEYQNQIHADNSGNCLVTNEKSEIIDEPQTDPIQNCGAMQVNIGGFTDCSTRDVGISGSATGVTVKIESASLGVTKLYYPTYCQFRSLVGLPVDTTKTVNRYTYTITAPGYETMIGTADLVRTPYNAPGSKYDGYVYYNGGIFAMYRQKTHIQGALRVTATPYSYLPVKITGPNGYSLDTVTEDAGGDVEGLAPGIYTVELIERPYSGLGARLGIPESARKQEVSVETGKVTLVYFSDRFVVPTEDTPSLSTTASSTPLAFVIPSPSPVVSPVASIAPSVGVTASPTIAPNVTATTALPSSSSSVALSIQPSALPSADSQDESQSNALQTDNSQTVDSQPTNFVQSLLSRFTGTKSVQQEVATPGEQSNSEPLIPGETQEITTPSEPVSSPRVASKKGILRRFADWLKEFFFGDLTI